jgi:tRNA threonylcarbamoyl adenosine modification protein YeaZ
MSNESSNQPITLALELSQQTGSVAICDSCGTIVERPVESGRREEDDVMPSIESIAGELHVSPRNISRVVISIGPGGFTGLRSSVAIAKMVALVSGAKIIPIDSALSIVANANAGFGRYLVVSAVKQESFWLSTVCVNNEDITCSASLSNAKVLSPELEEVCAIFGDAYLPKSVVAIAGDANVEIKEPKTSAKVLLELGLRMYKENKIPAIDPLALLPLYPREPEAVRVWNINHEKAKTDN